MSKMPTAKQVADAQVTPAGYVYQIAPIDPDTFVAISSDDTLTLFSSSNSSLAVQFQKRNAHKGLTCIAQMGTSILTAGRDGTIKGFASPKDANPSFTLTTPSGKGISALAVDAERRIVAAGTEHTEEGPGDVQVYVWLLDESVAQPARSYIESHTDTVTNLLFDPRNPNRLISASTDGLINVFDLSIADEDDAVEQAINNKAAISHLSLDESDDGLRILSCITHDEKISFYELKDEPEENEQAAEAWSLKNGLQCDYAIKLAKANGSLVLAIGVNKEETSGFRVDICTIQLHRGLLQGRDVENSIKLIARLEGVHGDEVVRDIWFDKTLSRLLTAAEDGCVKLWKNMVKKEDGGGDSKKSAKKSRKSERSEKGRFAPY